MPAKDRSLMRPGRRGGYAIAAALLIGVGLLTRWPALELPAVLAKYAGSAIWGAMVFCVVGTIRPRWPVPWIAGSALLIAGATELSQLLHPEWLDAFRRTTVGVLLLGRFFSWGDIVAYAGGIALAGLAACWIVRACGPSARRRADEKRPTRAADPASAAGTSGSGKPDPRAPAGRPRIIS